MTYPRTERQAELMAVADRLAARFAETAALYDRTGDFPFAHFAALHETGYLALTVPEEYGGRGANPLELALAQERLAHGCAATALGATMHLTVMAIQGETRTWPEEVYARVCRDVVERGALINSIHSEPDMGSPSRGALPSTTAVRTADGWVLNGHKRWASLAPGLTYADVLAAVSDGDEPPRRGNFLVPMDLAGITIEETWDNLGMRATASHDVIFTDVHVPAKALLPATTRSVPGGNSGWGLFPVPAVYLGVAGAARKATITFAQERVPNGMSGPIAELQTVQHRIAEMELLYWQARTVFYDVAERWVADPAARPGMAWEAAAAKHVVTNNVMRITDLALRVAGSAALSRTLPLERYFRDARAGLGHPPMDDVALTTIGKHALGLDGERR
ncbi:MAG: acyl-CoA/acyl-ACP dehydrogenase [Chloroflexota bacterium]|nr:acyl-CoA/acyl-ACP dehydrogenase [Chloroflexota bacterium]